MGALIHQLKDPYEALAVSNNKVVGPWVKANRSQLQLSGASITLLSLKTESLVKAFGNIDVREGPPVAIVPPNVNREVM